MAHALRRPQCPAPWRRIGTTSLLMAGLAWSWTGGAAGQVQLARQEDVKATFLYNFAKFVEWPEDATSAVSASFGIEIIGRDPFDGRFDQLMIGKKMNDLPIEVIHSFEEPSTRPVRVAFVSSSEEKRLDSLLNTYRLNRVLTVSDIPDFAQRGGMIGFVAEFGTLRFRINQASADRSELRVSSRLLALAR